MKYKRKDSVINVDGCVTKIVIGKHCDVFQITPDNYKYRSAWPDWVMEGIQDIGFCPSGRDIYLFRMEGGDLQFCAPEYFSDCFELITSLDEDHTLPTSEGYSICKDKLEGAYVALYKLHKKTSDHKDCDGIGNNMEDINTCISNLCHLISKEKDSETPVKTESLLKNIEVFQMTRKRRVDMNEWPEWLTYAWQLEEDEIGALTCSKSNSDGMDKLMVIAEDGEYTVGWGDYIVRNSDNGQLGVCAPCFFREKEVEKEKPDEETGGQIRKSIEESYIDILNKSHDELIALYNRSESRRLKSAIAKRIYYFESALTEARI